MKSVLFSLSVLTIALSTSPMTVASEESGFTRDGHTLDSLAKVKQEVTKGRAILLDVREKAEWDRGHLRASSLLPLSVIRTGEFTDEQKKLLPKDKPVYCHCASGGRVLIVSELLRERGHDIRPLKGGFLTLVKAGFRKAPSKSAD